MYYSVLCHSLLFYTVLCYDVPCILPVGILWCDVQQRTEQRFYISRYYKLQFCICDPTIVFSPLTDSPFTFFSLSVLICLCLHLSPFSTSPSLSLSHPLSLFLPPHPSLSLSPHSLARMGWHEETKSIHNPSEIHQTLCSSQEVQENPKGRTYRPVPGPWEVSRKIVQKTAQVRTAIVFYIFFVIVIVIVILIFVLTTNKEFFNLNQLFVFFLNEWSFYDNHWSLISVKFLRWSS